MVEGSAFVLGVNGDEWMGDTISGSAELDGTMTFLVRWCCCDGRIVLLLDPLGVGVVVAVVDGA